MTIKTFILHIGIGVLFTRLYRQVSSHGGNVIVVLLSLCSHLHASRRLGCGFIVVNVSET